MTTEDLGAPHRFSDDEMRLNDALEAIMDAGYAYQRKRIDRQTQLAIIDAIERHFVVTLKKEPT